MSGISLRKVWIGVAIALSAVAWACTLSTSGPEGGRAPLPTMDVEAAPVSVHTPVPVSTPVRVHIPLPTPEATPVRVHVPVPTLEATPESAPYRPPYELFVVDRSESTLSVVWDKAYGDTTYYEVKRSSSENGEYAIVATKVATMGLVDEGLQPDSLYYYGVRACNHLGCSEFTDYPVAGLTESDADVGAPAVPKDLKFSRREITLFPDLDVVTWNEVEGATYYKVYRAGGLLREVSAPLTHSSHTDLGRSFGLSSGTAYQVRACNKAGCSPLSQKVFQGEDVSRGNAENVRTPVDGGAADAYGDISLHQAISEDQIDIVRALVDAGADVNATDVLGNSLLQIAVRGNKADIVQVLIDAGADVDARDMHGDPILHDAVDSPRKNSEVVRMLIDAGANVNARDRHGDPLLHKAISRNRANVAQLLVDAGADVNATDAFGDPPLQVARWFGRTDIVEILLEAGAVE